MENKVVFTGTTPLQAFAFQVYKLHKKLRVSRK